jgi:poly-beta-hydroxyalkanoate depolymerase
MQQSMFPGQKENPKQVIISSISCHYVTIMKEETVGITHQIQIISSIGYRS